MSSFSHTLTYARSTISMALSNSIFYVLCKYRYLSKPSDRHTECHRLDCHTLVLKLNTPIFTFNAEIAKRKKFNEKERKKNNISSSHHVDCSHRLYISFFLSLLCYCCWLLFFFVFVFINYQLKGRNHLFEEVVCFDFFLRKRVIQFVESWAVKLNDLLK